MTTAPLAYIDAPTGVSGDMLLGALIGLGLEPAFFEDIARRLGLADVRVVVRPVRRAGIEAQAVDVQCDAAAHARHLSDILALIAAAGLPEPVATRARAAFGALGAAEAAVHGVPVEHVHFHEVGAVDALVDIVGAVAGFHALGITRIVASPLPLGGGTVTFSHGTHGLPAPATARLIEGLPVYGVAWQGETVTPTGAALVKTLAAGFGPLPPMLVRGHGRGAGRRDLPVANVLRIFVGEPLRADEWHADEAAVVTASIDDMNPQAFPAAFDALFAAGALDVYVTPILMKKGRPAHLLNALCPAAVVDAVTSALFRHTTSIGCRVASVQKRSLPRRAERVDTAFGPVPVKVASLGGEVVRASAEYEVCAERARSAGVPVGRVLAAAEAAAYTRLHPDAPPK